MSWGVGLKRGALWLFLLVLGSSVARSHTQSQEHAKRPGKPKPPCRRLTADPQVPTRDRAEGPFSRVAFYDDDHQRSHARGCDLGKALGSNGQATSVSVIPAAAARGQLTPSVRDPPSAMLDGLGTYSHHTTAFNCANWKCSPCAKAPRSSWGEVPFTMV